MLVLSTNCLIACGSPQLPSPQTAVDSYSRAIKDQDAGTLRAMMTKEARDSLSEPEIESILKADKVELSRRARDFSSDETSLERTSLLFLSNGREVRLLWQRGGFRLDEAAALPARPQSPAQVLALLEDAVESKDYELFFSLLSKSAREELDATLSALQQSLNGRNAAIVESRGDTAVIELPDGLQIELVREHGAWRIEELR